MIKKKDDPYNGKQYLYEPTPKALDLMIIIPVMLELISWSGKYDPKTAAPSEFLAALETSLKKVNEKSSQNFKK